MPAIPVILRKDFSRDSDGLDSKSVFRRFVRKACQVTKRYMPV
jgi:hypothetical protein